MKQILDANAFEGKIARFMLVTIIAFYALQTADFISAFALSFTFLTLAMLIGYGFTGLCFGYLLWLMFAQRGMKVVYFLPLFLLFGQWVKSYLAFDESGRSADFSPLSVLGYMLTSELGFNQLLVIPIGAYLALRYFSKRHAVLAD